MATILLIFGVLLIGRNVRAAPNLVHVLCTNLNNGTVGTSEARHQNLTEFLQYNSSIALKTYRFKFNGVTNGDIPNKVYVLFQCREDSTPDGCAVCVNHATSVLLSDCSLYDEGVVWYEECMLRYAYRNIFSLNETYPSHTTWSNEVSNVAEFSGVVAKSVDDLIRLAAVGNNGSYFGASETNLKWSSEKLYCFAQCTPDLDVAQCQSCLNLALANITSYTNESIYAMAFLPSCQLRYDNKPILVGDELVAPSPSMLPPTDQTKEGLPTSNKKRSLKPAIIVAIASSTLFGLVLLVVGLWFCLRHKTHEESSEKVSEGTDGLGDGTMDDMSSLESLQYDFTSIKAATNNFSEKNKLGQGGFGEVYKGKLSNGEEIAVKRLSRNSQQGVIEFKNEVLLLAKLQHRNLVKLLGFCILGAEKILIYEFLSNSSLDGFLYDPLKRAFLEWELRFKIITGMARGLLYLHEDSRLKIIHRDLKASNILLDEAMNAKIADFGIAKLFDFDQTQGNTMRIAGTYGYMAPEYAIAGHFSVKSDVYSFGVIVLEMLSGQRNSFFHQQPNEGLLYRAWKLWNEDAILELVDKLLGNNFSEEEVKLCIRIGLLCIQEDATHRPRMATVVAALNGQSIALPVPNAPHFFTIGALTDTTSSNYDSVPGNDVQQTLSDNNNDAFTGTTNVTKFYPR